MQTHKPAIDSFLRHCQFDRNFSHHTLKAYRLDLDRFGRFVESLQPATAIPDLDRTHLRDYARTLIEHKPRTQRRKIAAVKSLFGFLDREGVLKTNPTRDMRLNIRVPRALPRTIGGSAVKSLLRNLHKERDRCLNSGSPSSKIIRDTALFELLFSSGMRVSEISALRTDSVDLRKGAVLISGKGSKERLIPLCDDEVLSALKDYAKLARDSWAGDFFFQNRFGRRLSEQSIRLALKRHAKAAGLKPITPHMLRHTVATMLLEQGVDLRFIQAFLGHSSIVTTTIYVHVNEKSQRNVLSRRHPRRLLGKLSTATEHVLHEG